MKSFPSTIYFSKGAKNVNFYTGERYVYSYTGVTYIAEKSPYAI